MTGLIEQGSFPLKQGKTVLGSFPKIERSSPTLGKPAPEGAVILFDGTDASAWDKDDIIENGLLRNDEIATREEFESYHLHLEFRTPYKPYAREGERGNSGVLHQSRYEVDILDSFGKGTWNENGGLWSIRDADLNMSLPPLTWQTHDVDFTSAEFDAEGSLVEPARITVRLNGVVIHDNVELSRTSTNSKKKFGPGPGSIFILGNDKNLVYFRNIWLVKN